MRSVFSLMCIITAAGCSTDFVPAPDEEQSTTEPTPQPAPPGPDEPHDSGVEPTTPPADQSELPVLEYENGTQVTLLETISEAGSRSYAGVHLRGLDDTGTEVNGTILVDDDNRVSRIILDDGTEVDVIWEGSDARLSLVPSDRQSQDVQPSVGPDGNRQASAEFEMRVEVEVCDDSSSNFDVFVYGESSEGRLVFAAEPTTDPTVFVARVPVVTEGAPGLNCEDFAENYDQTFMDGLADSAATTLAAVGGCLICPLCCTALSILAFLSDAEFIACAYLGFPDGEQVSWSAAVKAPGSLRWIWSEPQLWTIGAPAPVLRIVHPSCTVGSLNVTGVHNSFGTSGSLAEAVTANLNFSLEWDGLAFEGTSQPNTANAASACEPPAEANSWRHCLEIAEVWPGMVGGVGPVAYTQSGNLAGVAPPSGTGVEFGLLMSQGLSAIADADQFTGFSSQELTVSIRATLPPSRTLSMNIENRASQTVIGGSIIRLTNGPNPELLNTFSAEGAGASHSVTNTDAEGDWLVQINFLAVTQHALGEGQADLRVRLDIK